ncbi:hypothetical protein T06_16778, partial [Trichinella sp. T6]
LFRKENSESSSKATKINEYYTESTQHKVWLNQLESVKYFTIYLHSTKLLRRLAKCGVSRQNV